MSTHMNVTGQDPAFYYDLAVEKKHWNSGWEKRALDTIRSLFERGKVRSMLEVGCGVGDIIPFLPGALEYTGLDPVQFSINEARNTYPARKFVQGYAEDTPFDDDAFDLVFSYQTIQSFERPREALSEMARVIRPGGYILTLAPNLEAPWSRISAVRHYSRLQWLVFVAKRSADLLLRFFGVSRFRIIPESYLEATGRYEKGDDGLKYVTSTWEVVRFLKSRGFIEVDMRMADNLFLRVFPPLRYYGGGMYLLLQKTRT